MPRRRPAALLLAVAALPFARPVTTDTMTPAPALSAAADPLPPLACTQTRFARLLAATDLTAVLATAETGDTAGSTGPDPRGGVAGTFDMATAGVADESQVRPWVRVQSPAELEDTLRATFAGTVLVPKDVRWDMTGRSSIPLRSGVWLVGERGALCSRPTLFTDAHDAHSLFEVSANDVRVEGIHFRGPSAGSRSPEQPYVNALRVLVDRERGLGRRIVITDSEFDEWPGSGVDVRSSMRVRTPAQYDPSWPRPIRADADLVRIERNFMHHNARDGGGYGVTVGGGAYATVWGNVFDYNRHAVASDGFAYTGYIARFNYVLQGGFMVSSYWNQHFDVHGTNDTDGDNRSTGYGGTAGEYYEIAFNTIRGEQTYYQVKTRSALMLRGEPTEGARFDGNVLVHDDLDAAVSLKGSENASGIGEHHDEFNFDADGNRFDTDHSSELAAGDFDGDGRTDVFVATGTAWYVSRAGVEPWQFLHPSNKRVAELGFADMNDDGVTDVVWRDPNGNLGYLRNGAGPVVPLTTSPVPVNELRFGDFDGDGKTDIWRREPSGQWMIRYGRSGAWTPAQSSSLALSALRFGEFDGTRGTDVVAVLRDRWAVSSSATAPWARLNARLRRSFADAVVADFDGDGRSDLAFDDGRQLWSFSPGGSGPIRSLREGAGQTPFKPLGTLLVGRFDGDAGAEVVSFWDPFGVSRGALSDHLTIWRGGRQSLFAKLSWAAMR